MERQPKIRTRYDKAAELIKKKSSGKGDGLATGAMAEILQGLDAIGGQKVDLEEINNFPLEPHRDTLDVDGEPLDMEFEKKENK